ncbi:helix-hairpin-helix domain-containing protein [uncultured Clostridium sp.]|uniref:helix-hairpin-helix domain-containing protein n=1 Tax=uncultured Clostridium sp. TaxID=59620 RepID=UPI0025DD7F08|nr:helix-hairpin-helix domain-containing protein [uncultured Clostridium sp.]
MKDKLLKYKKIGLISILVIVILSALIVYNTSGFNELNINNNESIFVDEENIDIEENAQKISEKDLERNSQKSSTAEDSKETGKKSGSTLQNKTIIVEIKGQVAKPDVYTLDENSIVNDLINMAGGITENADLSSINRAKKLQNHEMIYIADKTQNDSLREAVQNSEAALSSSVSESLVDINTATAEQLKTLNGIGDSKAKSIIEYREQNGGFKSIEEIKNVTGIGEKMFEKIKDSITV